MEYKRKSNNVFEIHTRNIFDEMPTELSDGMEANKYPACPIHALERISRKIATCAPLFLCEFVPSLVLNRYFPM